MKSRKFKVENRRSKIANRQSPVAGRTLAMVLLVTCHLSFATVLMAQQPQAQPLYKTNSEAVQWVGPGNWIYGADVNLYVNASTGNDSTGNGTSASPYATIARALQDVPEFVSQHYLINLAAGTYYEQVNITGRYFGTNLVTNFKQAAIELRGSTAVTSATAPLLSSVAGGTLAATTYYVKATYVNASGETLASAESSLAVAASNLLKVTGLGATGDATGWNVYVSTAAGTETKQNTSAIAIATNWTEPTTGLISGAATPTLNTMGDAYVISGATSGAPTTPSRNFGVANSGGNLILNGLSIQYASQVNLWQSGGVTVTNNVTLRHATTAAPSGYQGLGAFGMYVWNGLAVMMGTLTVSDVYNGITADHHALITASGDPVNSGFSFGNESVTGVTGGVGIGAYVNSEIDTDGQGGPVTLTGTNVAGSVGIQSRFFSDVWWDGGTIGSFPTLVDAEVGGLVTGSWFAFQNATTGILLTTGGRFETLTTATVTFTGVTTPRSIVQGGMSFEPSGNYFDGKLTSTGAVSLAAGGTNQNVTLTPSGTGFTVLNGNVGIGASSPSFPLQLSGAASTTFPNLPLSVFLGSTNSFGQGLGSGIGLGGTIDVTGAQTTFAAISGIKENATSGDTAGALTLGSRSTGGGLATERMRITSTGNVGIGTSTPQTQLDVSGPIRSSAVTFATLPACSATIEGAMRGVTDSTVATWGSTIAGAGTNHVLAYCDGAAWTVAAK